ncbi:nitroreductase family protein, partial [Rhodococcus sp. A5(2022)]|uniref:nitroreductase family protein n=1 Tax=Rhodococcus sp. A5(2022) TaxID=3003588 RepID=UPI0022A81766
SSAALQNFLLLAHEAGLGACWMTGPLWVEQPILSYLGYPDWGLVGITPACGYVTPGSALFIGAVAGLLCFAACTWIKMRLRYDDSLDVFGVHGVAGMWGTVATGLFFAPDAH